MKPLPIRPKPQPTEQIRGYLTRLALANGYENAERFWSVVCPAGDPVRTLAALLKSESIPVLSGPLPSWLRWPIRAETLGRSHFNLRHMRVCPACMAEAEWFRPQWALIFSVVCARHGIWLQSDYQGDEASDPSEDPLPKPLSGNAPAIVVALNQILDFAFEGLSNWGHPLLPMLDHPLSVDQIARLIHILGGFAHDQYSARPGQLPSASVCAVAQARVAGAAALLDDWPKNFHARLARMMAGTTDLLSVRKPFGRLYAALHKDLAEPEFQFLRDSFRAFLREHWRGELSGRNSLLGTELIVSHGRISFSRAVRDLGIPPAHLASLVESGQVEAVCVRRSKDRSFVTFDLEQLLAAAAASPPAFDLHGLSQLFGIGERRVRQLVDNGILMAESTNETSSDGRWHFAQELVFDLLAGVAKQSNVKHDFRVAVRLTRILTYWRINEGEWCQLLRALTDGVLKSRVAMNSCLGDTELDALEVKAWLRRIRQPSDGWVGIQRAARILCLKDQVVYELVSRGLIRTVLITNRGPCFRAIAVDELARFENEYVPLRDLAKLHQTSPKYLLDQIDFRPISGPNIDGLRQYFYRRKDIVMWKNNLTEHAITLAIDSINDLEGGS